MSFCIGRVRFSIGYEVAAAITAVLLIDRENRVIGCILAAILHEAGHLVMMLLFHVRVKGVKIRLFDILIEADEPDSFLADVCVTLGGVGMNFLLAGVSVVLAPFFCMANLAMGIFNLMPAVSLDGGRLLTLIVARRYGELAAGRVLRIVSFLILLPLMTAGILFLFRSGYNYSLLAISLYLLAVLLLKK